MKKIIVCVIAFLLALVIGLIVYFECMAKRKIDHRIPIYVIGVPYEFGTSTVQINLDENNERFVFQFKTNGYVDVCEFDFDFYIHDGTSRKSFCDCSQEFQYIDSAGHEIIFYEHVSYTTTKDLTMYIYYKNASPEIKAAIDERKFSLRFSGYGHFELY